MGPKKDQATGGNGDTETETGLSALVKLLKEEAEERRKQTQAAETRQTQQDEFMQKMIDMQKVMFSAFPQAPIAAPASTPQIGENQASDTPLDRDAHIPPIAQEFGPHFEVIRQHEQRSTPWPSFDRRREESAGSPSTISRDHDNSQGGDRGRADYRGRHHTQEPPRTKLATYDGKEDWDVFFLPFERLARRMQWTTLDKLDRLHECMRGSAARYISLQPVTMQESYGRLSELLQQRFGRKDPPTTARQKLADLRQQKESSEEFAEEVQRLITLAYPGVSVDTQEKLAAETFLKGYRNARVAYQVMCQDPLTIGQAVSLVETCEHHYRATVGRGSEPATRQRARRVSWADEEEEEEAHARRVSTPTYVAMDEFKDHLRKQEQQYQKLNECLQKLLSTRPQHDVVTKSSTDGSTRPSRSPTREFKGKCYGCGGTGHFKRDCSRSPSPSPKSSGNE